MFSCQPVEPLKTFRFGTGSDRAEGIVSVSDRTKPNTPVLIKSNSPVLIESTQAVSHAATYAGKAHKPNKNYTQRYFLCREIKQIKRNR